MKFINVKTFQAEKVGLRAKIYSVWEVRSLEEIFEAA